MIYDIALGAFIALAAHDLISHLAHQLVIQIRVRRRIKNLDNIMDTWGYESEGYVFSPVTTRKKATTKKKAVAKRK